MTAITHHEYHAEIAHIAQEIADEVNANGEDHDHDVYDLTHEWVDSHQWVLYTAYHYEVLAISSNDGAYVENYGPEGLVKDGELNTAAMAFAAIMQDVQEHSNYPA